MNVDKKGDKSMKWLVFSDSHGKLDYMKRAVEEEKPDKILHLGDVIRDARNLQECFPDLEMEWVVGNCDGYNGDDSAPDEREIFMGGKRILMCHGHTYQVKLGIGMLMNEARGRGVDIVLFGHTHVPQCFLEGSLWVLNPGTVSGMPQATYGVIELENGRLNCRTAEMKRIAAKGEEKRRWFF